MLLFQVDKVFIQSKINLDRHGCYGVKKKSKFCVLTGEKLDEINARLEHSIESPLDTLHMRPELKDSHVIFCFVSEKAPQHMNVNVL